ncbi:MAG: hypothetical protein KGZ35_05945 [Truepera sp.]|nr:hypothetical protein [Truepera sp.]
MRRECLLLLRVWRDGAQADAWRFSVEQAHRLGQALRDAYGVAPLSRLSRRAFSRR